MLEAISLQRDYNETNDLIAFLRLIRNDSVVFDLGANSGWYSVLPGLKYPNSKIYAFEPSPNNFKRLKLNVELNALKNVSIFQLAIGDSEKAIDFFDSPRDQLSYVSSAVLGFGQKFHDESWVKISVPQTTLDSFCKSEQISRLDIIKIDVEGYEVNVLKGALNVIKQYRPIIQIESFLEGNNRAFLERFVESNNYHIYAVLSEGIVFLNSFDFRVGLNFLLIPSKLEGRFIPMARINELVMKSEPISRP